MVNDLSSPTTNRQWKSFYKIAAIAAIIIAVFIPIQGAIFALWPPPKNVMDWFALFQRNKWIGLLDMDLLLTVDYMLMLLIFLALWAALRRTNSSLTTVALTFQVVSIAAYLSSTAAFEMLHLSNQYAAAQTDMERIVYVAAGQSAYTKWQGTAFNVSYFLGFIAMVTLSIGMLKSTVFNKTTAYLGLIAGMLMAVPPTAGMFGMVLSFLSLVPTIPWLILVSIRLLQLSKFKKQDILYKKKEASLQSGLTNAQDIGTYREYNTP